MALITSGCQSLKIERLVKLIDTEQNRPAANKTLFFNAETDPWGAYWVNVEVPLDRNGESRVRLRPLRWSINTSLTDQKFNYPEKMCGTAILPSEFQNGGVFRLYGRPPTPTDTNLYPSKFLLEIRQP